MNLILIGTVIVCCVGIYFLFPKMPRIAQIIVAVVGVLICFYVLAHMAGVPL